MVKDSILTHRRRRHSRLPSLARAKTPLKANFFNFYVEKVSMSQNRYKNFVTSEFLRMRRLRVGHFPQQIGVSTESQSH